MQQGSGLRGSAALIVIVLALALSGCQVPFGAHVTVKGTIYGEQLAAREAGNSVPMPIPATVNCNGASGTTRADGTFSLSVSQSNTYSCTASAPNYTSMTASFSGKGSDFTLDFGPKRAAHCTATKATATTTCSVLAPETATLRGTVTNATNDTALGNVKVTCWSAAMDDTSSDGSSRFNATTDSQGNYVFHDLPINPYGCAAGSDQRLQSTTVKPGQTTTLDIATCVNDCSTFTYHQGPVIHHLTAYLLFWLPTGYTFEPSGNDSSYEKLITQYFQDVGGTPFYNILTQYYDLLGGPVRNTVTVGGTFVDTQPYPKAGTESDPLLDGDVSHEIDTVLAAKKGAWVADNEHMVFIFTGYNVQECSGQMSFDGCTFTHNTEADFCAYHSNTLFNSLIYAYIPDVDGCLYLPSNQSPNNDPIADAVISTVSHEQFEAVSDPQGAGWFDSNEHEGEMADKCVGIYGPIDSTGGNVTLAHGHHYLIQQEWSLRDQQCVLSLSS